MKPKNFRINQAEEALEQARQWRITVIKDVQSCCEHKDVGETDELVDEYSQKYGRVCLECGYSVETNPIFGWGKLSRPLAYKITTVQYFKLQRSV